MDGALPTIIGDKYEVVRVIGRGGMGTVYEARHTLTQKRFAVKVTHAWVVERHRTAGPRFLREAQIGSTIEHPAIVEVLDGGQQTDGSFYLVFEMLEGRDLAAAAKELTPSELSEICIEVLDGLDAAHAKNVVHRDVKPGNVFLAEAADGTRSVKLLDFGIAKQLDDTIESITRTGDVVGTIEFMSPEQAAGDLVDARTDIYGVGALLFVGMTKTQLFPGESPLERFQKLLSVPAPPVRSLRPDISIPLAAVVDRALLKHPDERFQTAKQMRSALEDALRQEPMKTVVVRERSISRGDSVDLLEAGTVAPDTWVPPTKETRRRIGWWGVAIGVLAVGVATAALVATLREDPSTAAASETKAAPRVADAVIEAERDVAPVVLSDALEVAEPTATASSSVSTRPPEKRTPPVRRKRTRRRRPRRPPPAVAPPTPEPPTEAAPPKPKIDEPFYTEY